MMKLFDKFAYTENEYFERTPFKIVLKKMIHFKDVRDTMVYSFYWGITMLKILHLIFFFLTLFSDQDPFKEEEDDGKITYKEAPINEKYAKIFGIVDLLLLFILTVLYVIFDVVHIKFLYNNNKQDYIPFHVFKMIVYYSFTLL